MTFLLAISSLFSRLLGVYRNHALAQAFGASELSDAYFAAFQIPDTLYKLLVFGAISASFVPLYLSLLRKNKEDARDFVVSVMNGFLILIGIIALITFIFAPFFVKHLYPAFRPELMDETTRLLRIMLLSPIFFTFSSVFSGIQNAFRTFWGFALAPLVYNAGIIFGILYLTPLMGISGVAWGVVGGAFAHAFVQFFPALRLGFRWGPVFHWSKEFKTLLLTAIPRVLSMASFQMNFFIEGIIATTLFVGNLTVLRYAQDIQSFPIGIIGVSVAISSFSVLSDLVIDEDVSKLAQYVRDKLEHLFMLLIPAAFGLYVLRYPVVKLILEGGIFDGKAVEVTSTTIAYLCIGLVAAAVTPFISRVYFAFHDTVRPFWVMIATVMGNTLLALLLVRYSGVAGIGLASSISSTVALVVLLFILSQKYLPEDSFFPFKNTLIFVTSGAVMAYFLEYVLRGIIYSESSMILMGQIMLASAFGVILYFSVAFLFLKKKLFHLIKTFGS